jgi:Secretion system C-terminal sorting domain
MKKIFLLLILLVSKVCFSQIVNIPDANGQVVRSLKNVNENYLQMDLSELLHGVYFVQVVGNYKDKYVTKFIKN